ncbi:MAG: hypothetical protein H6865_02760 [Rhodospirillales bacterium]|nr:hypothetical protein [Alphaproteobacteria bacterium]MCB9986537.1 hypothetical protein [Rhodospirillales bacterium]USO06927.1 MAG: hypothetical protein H6866_05625 [Rhodospirillales bacterium]
MGKILTRKFLKLPLWLWLTLALFIAGGALGFVLTRPQHAGWRYGVCRAYLELYLRFPETIRIDEGGETSTGAMLIFADVNPFGSEQVRMWECYFTRGNDGNVTLSRITIDRRALPAALIQKYAQMLPVLAGLELNTALPKELPNDLEDLKD